MIYVVIYNYYAETDYLYFRSLIIIYFCLGLCITIANNVKIRSIIYYIFSISFVYPNTLLLSQLSSIIFSQITWYLVSTQVYMFFI